MHVAARCLGDRTERDEARDEERDKERDEEEIGG